VEVLAELDEVDDVGDRLLQRLAGQPEVDEARLDVHPARELRVEADAEVHQRVDAAIDADLARGHRAAPGDELEQCGLAGAVAPDEPDALAGAHPQVDPAQREEPGRLELATDPEELPDPHRRGTAV